MSDTPLFGLELPDDVSESGWTSTSPSAAVIDARDYPQPHPGPAPDDPARDGWEDVKQRGPIPARFPVAVRQPVPTIPAGGRILFAHTLEIAAGDTNPRSVGLQASTVQRATIAYTLLTITGGDGQLAGEDNALPTMRFPFPAGAALALEHVSGAFVWGDPANDVTIGVLVVGVR
jgi:hypothetical protein